MSAASLLTRPMPDIADERAAVQPARTAYVVHRDTCGICGPVEVPELMHCARGIRMRDEWVRAVSRTRLLVEIFGEGA